MPVLEITKAEYETGGYKILDSVSLSVESGGRLSIIGPNGAGKTTLLKCIMKLIRITAGEIVIDGNDLNDLSQKHLAAMVGYVPQQTVNSCPFTVEEFVLLSRYPHLSPFSRIRREDRSAMESALMTTGTEDLAGRYYDTLSGGEKQLVSIASVLAQGARLLLLDEPSAYLDPSHSLSVNRLIDRLIDDLGITVVSVTHDINDALLCGGTLCLLREGSVIFNGDPEDVVSSGALERLYGRNFKFSKHPVTGQRYVLPDTGRPI